MNGCQTARLSVNFQLGTGSDPGIWWEVKHKLTLTLVCDEGIFTTGMEYYYVRGDSWFDCRTWCYLYYIPPIRPKPSPNCSSNQRDGGHEHAMATISDLFLPRLVLLLAFSLNPPGPILFPCNQPEPGVDDFRPGQYQRDLHTATLHCLYLLALRNLFLC